MFFTGGWRITQLDEHGADNYITPVLTRQEALDTCLSPMPGGTTPSWEPPEECAQQNYRDSDWESGWWEVRTDWAALDGPPL